MSCGTAVGVVLVAYQSVRSGHNRIGFHRCCPVLRRPPDRSAYLQALAARSCSLYCSWHSGLGRVSVYGLPFHEVPAPVAFVEVSQ